jgi:hypothetical protein
MSQMIITDLSFCENTGANIQQIKGGNYSPSVSASVSKDLSVSHNTFFDLQQLDNSHWRWNAGYNVAVAAGVAGAISVGGSVYTAVNVSTQVG